MRNDLKISRMALLQLRILKQTNEKKAKWVGGEEKCTGHDPQHQQVSQKRISKTRGYHKLSLRSKRFNPHIGTPQPWGLVLRKKSNLKPGEPKSCKDLVKNAHTSLLMPSYSAVGVNWKSSWCSSWTVKTTLKCPIACTSFWL